MLKKERMDKCPSVEKRKKKRKKKKNEKSK
jgi:hypothetical protein